MAPLVLAVVGVVALGRGHGFWYDEVYTAELARLPLEELLTAVVRGEGTIPYLRDAPPSYNGPYYAFVHLWLLLTPLDATELGLRLPSLLAAVAAVLVFSRAVGRLAGPRVGVVAGLFLAANPFVVQYAVEARGYGLALLGTCLAALGLARWLDGRDRPSVVLYGVGATVAGLFHWYALLAVAGLAAAAVVLRGRRAERRAAGGNPPHRRPGTVRAGPRPGRGRRLGRRAHRDRHRRGARAPGLRRPLPAPGGGGAGGPHGFGSRPVLPAR